MCPGAAPRIRGLLTRVAWQRVVRPNKVSKNMAGVVWPAYNYRQRGRGLATVLCTYYISARTYLLRCRVCVGGGGSDTANNLLDLFNRFLLPGVGLPWFGSTRSDLAWLMPGGAAGGSECVGGCLVFQNCLYYR